MIFRKLIPLAALALLPALALAQNQMAPEDPWLWLEDIEGARALTQVKAWNADTDKLLTADPRYQSDKARARAILDDENQIAMPGRVMGDRITNFWRDAKNPRGLWRSAALADYQAGRPRWTTIIDVDALGKREGKSWVWHGANCLEPEYTRCLVSLSPGGTDADVVREFDLTTGKFVDPAGNGAGFTVPEAKSEVNWVDRDTLLIATDWGSGSLTTSGYPRIAKLWKRGTPLSGAAAVISADVKSVGLNISVPSDATARYPILQLSKSYWDTDYFLVGQDGKVIPIPLPDGATYEDVIEGRLIAKLQKPYKRLPEGSVVAYSIADIRTGAKPEPELVIAPTRAQAIEEISTTDHILWVKLLDDVSGKLLALTRTPGGKWVQRPIPLAANATVHIVGSDAKRDLAFATVEGMLTPPTLYSVPARGGVSVVQSLPAKFDARQFAVVQRFARSKDGTRVPYFLVTKRGAKGPAPALIHAYGGFRQAQTPTYLTGQPYRAGPLGLFWVEQGNAYVLANIRGGGEYGPRWHRDALREKRQNSFDDLHAVAEDLVRTRISAKGKIAISGRSNGGVLVGAAMTQRPDLYGAVISGSPLHDMQRYSKLSAGASWMDEYGNPDVPADWAFMAKYSPYQNLKPGVKYPPVFEYLSTKDDRVHPGHARKFTARLKEYGNTVYYHEYLEGGHSVGADNAEDANRAALLDAFLRRELMGVR